MVRMAELPGDEGGHSGSPSGSNPHDGAIDFTRYSAAQLEELRYSIDPRASPLNYAHLTAELEKRGSQEAQSADSTYPGRFTARDGVRGWLQAKRHGTLVYGAGSIECRPAGVALHGWRRTWLGVPYRDEVRLPLDAIRNVTCKGTDVEFEYSRPHWRPGRLRFSAETEAQARDLAGRLPAEQTPGFQARWTELSELRTRFEQIGGHVWATPALVTLNVAVFVAMTVSARRLGAFDALFIFNWGGNLGSLTVSGQWWRLLTSMFVHLDLLHLVLNMWALWSVGRLAERLYGSGPFVFVYFASGLLGSLASIAWDPSKISAGASGAIFGILGAYLAFLAHRDSRLPRQVIRAHWLSTLIFVLFNLVTGARNPLIDNAAHVGGLLSGIVLGWIMVRPLDAESRQEFPFHKTVAAVLVLAAATVAGLTQVLGLGSELSASEQFARTHLWYLQGETPNLVRWQELAYQINAGTISESEAGARFEQEIVPFWKMADARLQKELAARPRHEKSYVSDVADFSSLRLTWAQTIVRATKDHDEKSARELMPLMRQTDVALAHLERIQLRDSMSRRSRALAESALVSQVHALLSPRPACVHRPPAWGPQSAPTDASGDGPAARARAACQAQWLFLAGDYVTLDAQMARALRSLGDLPDGSSTFDGIQSGLDALLSFGGYDLMSSLARTAAWRHALPGSIYPELVEADVFEDWAWAARGTGAADQVSGQSWLVFAHRAEMAADALRQLGRRSDEDPDWYELSLGVGLDQSLDPEALRAVFDRGHAKFPKYHPLERGMLRILMPRWNGSYEKVDDFINTMARGPGASSDLETYARLYWMYDGLENDDINIFHDAKATWSSMKAGFGLMVARHPASDVVVNGFARFACLAGDGQQYTALRPRLATHYSATGWSNKVSLESCDGKFGIKRAQAGK